jgi:uncharacterized membrane protein YbhN (UPF0104 family)
MEFLRRRLGLIFRALVSIFAITWVVHTNDWNKVWLNVHTMDVSWLLVALVCFVPTLIICSWRWRMLLRIHDVHMRFWRIFELNMIGQFFSTVGVGTTGGDVFKIFYVTRAVPQRKAAVAFTVILDRVIGLVALLLFGATFAACRLQLLLSHPDTGKLTGTFYLFVLGGVVGSIAACLGPRLLQHEGIRALVKKLPFVHRGSSLFAAYERSARAIGVNFLALVGTVPSHTTITLMAYCVLLAMHRQPDFVAFCAIVAIVNMLIALPVSISGIGVREALFTTFLALLGIDKDHAVAFSLTFFALNIIWCLAGGPFYFLYRHETHTPPPDVREVEPIFSER